MTEIIYQDNTYQLFDCCCVSKIVDNQYMFFPHSLDCKVLQFVQEESQRQNHTIQVIKGNR